MSAIEEAGSPREVQRTGGLLTLNVRGGADMHIYPGALIAHRVGSQLGEIPDPDNPRTDLIVRGYATNEMIAYAASVDGDGNATDPITGDVLTVNVEPGIGLLFDTGTAGDEITKDDLGKVCFAHDDNTLYLTNSGNTLSPAGRVRYVDDDGKVALFVDDCPIDWRLFGAAAEGGILDTDPPAGTNLTDAAQTLLISGGNWRILPAATLSTGRVKTLGTTGAVAGNTITLTIFSQGYTTTITNGGGGGGSYVIPANSQPVAVRYQFDGTDWIAKQIAPFLIATSSLPGMMSAADKLFLDAMHAAKGTDLTNADATIQPSGGYWRTLPAATLTAAHALTLGTTNAVAGDWWVISRYDVTGYAYSIIDGGSGTPTLAVLPGGAPAFVLAQFDGTNWKIKACASLSDDWVTGTALTDTATTTVNRGGRRTSFLLAGTMSQGETITLGTTGATLGDIIRILRTSTSAQTAAIVNGGGGAGTIVTLPASKVNFAEARFDGTNWLFHGCGTQ